ncbi:MAG: YybH family protein [Geminicoccales bacterium]
MTGKTSDEARIRGLVEDRTLAILDKDLERVMASYAPEVVSFDAVDPLHNVGAEAVRARLQAWFAAYDGPIRCEVRDLVAAARDDVAFAHSLHRFSGTMTSGKAVDMWVRDTLCLRKIDGRWLVTHEHMSEPFDAETGQASLDLEP